MNATALLQELARLGVQLSTDGVNLKVQAAKGRLSPEQLKQLKQHKAAVIELLKDSETRKDRKRLPTIEPRVQDVHRPFPLSDLQWGFFVADDPFMEYHVRPHYYLEQDFESFDIKLYEAAWNRTLERHRKEIHRVNQDVQLELLGETPTIACETRDLRHLPIAEAKHELERLRKKLKRRQLPLDRWPWIELSITLWLEDGREKARVHYNHNNFFCDGFSLGLLMREVAGFYENPDLELPELELTFRDAVLALNQLAESPLGQISWTYWRQRLPDLPPPPPIPQLATVNRRSRSRLQRRQHKLPAEIWSDFKAQALHYGITVSNAVLAAYAEILSIWSASRHFILSQMVTRRFTEMHPEMMQILGNFASLYPLEVDWRQRDPFFTRARRLQDQVLRDLKHLDYGGMQVMQELNRQSGEFGIAPSPFVVGSGLYDKDYKKSDFVCLETSQTLLDFQYWELPDGRFFYVWDLLEEFFPDGLIDSMWQAFITLLERLSSSKESWNAPHFNLLPEGDLAARRRCNQTHQPVRAGLLHDHPKRPGSSSPALINSQGTLSYRELHKWSLAVARELLEAGCKKGDRVAIVADRGQELLTSAFATLHAGCVYVPLEPGLPTQRLHAVLRDSGASVALTDSRYAESLEWPSDVRRIRVDEYRDKATGDTTDHLPAVKSEDLAYVIYTSGSTGQPKGVMIDHRGALNTISDVNQRFDIGPNDRIFGVSSFSFDLSVYDVFGAFHSGACLVYPDATAALNPAHWLDVLLTTEVTIWNSVPALMRLLVETAQRQRMEIPSLRLVLLSGDKVPLDLPAEIATVAPNARVISMGGATEASIWSIIYPIGELEDGQMALPHACVTVPYGYPMVNQRWHVLDAERQPSPTWVPGELYIAGVGLAQGYWADSEKTAASFIQDSGTGERLYRTGDMGRYLADGCLEFLGRVDFQVKIQGHRVELGEIESTLIRHPLIKEATVVAKTVDKRGTQQLAGYVVPGEGEITVTDLRDFLKQHLPAYMIPSSWLLLEELPVTGNGKIDRKALVAMDGEATAGDRSQAQEYVAPRNDVETRLVEIWQEILELDRIGVADDFFDIGGQSFDCVRMFGIVKEEFGRTFSLGDIWNMRSIEKLAEQLNPDSATTTRRRLVGIEVERSGRPLFLVHPAGGHCTGYRQLAALLDSPVYGFQADGSDEMSTIGGVARRYVEELRQHQTSGPYLLGGWSTGAMIAFEMAAQLESAGQDVERVISLDGPTPTPHQDLGDPTLLRWFIEDLDMGLSLEALNSLDVSDLPLKEQLERALDLFGGERKLGLDISQLLPVYGVFRDLVIAGASYQPPRIRADVLAVRVEEDAVSEFADHPHRDREDWGWGLYTEGRVESARVPGNHHTFLTTPRVEQLARRLSAGNELRERDSRRQLVTSHPA